MYMYVYINAYVCTCMNVHMSVYVFATFSVFTAHADAKYFQRISVAFFKYIIGSVCWHDVYFYIVSGIYRYTRKCKKYMYTYIHTRIYVYIHMYIHIHICTDKHKYTCRTSTGIYIYRCKNALSSYHCIFRQESVVHVCGSGKIHSMSHAHTATAANPQIPPPWTVGYWESSPA